MAISLDVVPKPIALAIVSVSLLASVRSSGAERSPAQAPAVSVLEAMAARGEISAADGRRLVRSAGRSTPQIPEDSRYRSCGRAALVAARQWADSQGAKLLKDAPPAAGHLESVTLPIRVYFPAGKQGMAEEVLAAAEKAWNVQVVELGFPKPWADGEVGPVTSGAWLYIAPTGDTASGVTDPLADVPQTPNCDCSSRILIGEDLTSGQIEGVVAHEFNHATQMATDCTESISSFENFATAVAQTLVPEPSWFKSMTGAFQKYPEYPVDFWTGEYAGKPPSAYQYGASLFPLYLLQRFGKGDLRYLRDTWGAFAQNGTAIPGILFSCQPANEPNWFDGVDSMVQKSGSSFDEAFDEFSSWRAVAGAFDDGEHFDFGKAIVPAATVAELPLDSLPATADFAIHEYGSAHIPLGLPAVAAPLQILVKGDLQASWGASLLLWRDSAPVERLPLVFDGAKGSTSVEALDSVTRALLVVTQKKFKTHNPDNQNYVEERSFKVTIDAVAALDAGEDLDGGSDADSAGPADPGGSPGATEDAGCGCRASGSRPSKPFEKLLALLTSLFLVRRRRTSRSKEMIT